jgi:hypothetical protein
MVRLLMNTLERMWMEVVVAQLKLLSRHSPRDIQERRNPTTTYKIQISTFLNICEMKITVLWDVVLCSLAETERRSISARLQGTTFQNKVIFMPATVRT